MSPGIDVPPVRSLVHDARTDNLWKLFAATYKQEPEFVVRVPGRVNLIGEHIDYCGYGVLPMALEQDILLAVGPNSDHSLRLTNLDNQYEPYTCDIHNFTFDMEIDGPRWYKYFLCSVQGFVDKLMDKETLRGMNVAVTGNIPPNAGLSSSSAIVSAATLAIAHLHQMNIKTETLASMSARCEWYIGTQGGGMDQAIAFLATEGCAKLIDFEPLRWQDVALPPGAVFVIAHSLARLNKAATADFNCRVVECRLAAKMQSNNTTLRSAVSSWRRELMRMLLQVWRLRHWTRSGQVYADIREKRPQILAKRLKLDWMNISKPADLQKALGEDLPKMCSLVQELLHEEPYTKDELRKELEFSPEEFDRVALTPNTTHIQEFKLYQRVLHVYKEAQRVQEFYEECQRAASSGEGSLQRLGELMLSSHRSLRDLYECSHPQLDELVELSRDLAYGMRLTGAGWGGCAVALVSPDNVHKFMETIKEKFYKPRGIHSDLDTLMFATSPKAGACVFVP